MEITEIAKSSNLMLEDISVFGDLPYVFYSSLTNFLDFSKFNNPNTSIQ